MVEYPRDWKVSILDDVVKIKRGASPRPIESYLTFSTAGVNWIKIGDAPVDGKYIESTAEKITASGANRSVRVCRGDFVLSNSMSFGRPYLLNIEGCIHDGWLRLYDFQDNIDSDFLYYLLSSPVVKRQYISFAAGSGVQNLNKEVVKKVKVLCPPLPEQQVIASTLSNFDEHIDNLAELIEKKKAVRDGALEDLVSGRTRLSGFNGEWETTRLSDFAQINPSSALPEVFRYVDLESVKGISLLGWRAERKETAPSRAQRLAQKKDIFFQTVRPYQRNNYLFELPYNDFVFSTGYAQIRTKNNANFLFRLLRQDAFVDEVLDNCTGTSYPAINPTQLGEIEIFVPKDPKEQKAIADILTAMDEEIESLEEEKAKMMQIREGAMDDLLTGRVRLKV